MTDHVKRLAGSALNILPDRMNLFVRYITPVGNANLELDDSTLQSLRQATTRDGVPQSGTIYPYTETDDKAVTQTLGTFGSTVNNDGSVRITDTYDMENAYEDKDLVSGSFRPDKALLNLQGIYDNEARAKLINLIAKESGLQPSQGRPPMDNRSYNEKIHESGDSAAHSPLTQLGRSALYLLPYKPKPYDIDITIPPTKY
tara:strand:+ start:2567 stop:3169 length:603 start_codon:yes stop_codon:yes gene_type:complete